MAEMWMAALKTNSPALLILTLVALGLLYLIKRIELQRKDTGVKRNEQFSQMDKRFLEMKLETQKKDAAYSERVILLENKISLTRQEVNGVKDRLKTVDTKLEQITTALNAINETLSGIKSTLTTSFNNMEKRIERLEDNRD